MPNSPRNAPTPANSDRPASSSTSGSVWRRVGTRLNSGSAWLLWSALPKILALLIVVELATWLPHYLTWPWWVDHDAFAVLAMDWDAGVRPYRDVEAYNFPGAIYLFWGLGQVFGWGVTWPLYAVDAAGLIGLSALTLWWSRRRWGAWLPGLVVVGSWLGAYLSLNYGVTAQRDGHAAGFVAAGWLLASSRTGRVGLWLSAFCWGVAWTLRPHAILFVPGLALAVMLDRPGRLPRVGRLFSGGEWLVAIALMGLLGFAPLIAHGLLDDLLRGLQRASYGGNYSNWSWSGFLEKLGASLRDPWAVIALIGLPIIGWRGRRRWARPSWSVWVLLMGALLYRPMHPQDHEYLHLPLAIVLPLALGVMLGGWLNVRRIPCTLKLLATLSVSLWLADPSESLCRPAASWRSLTTLSDGDIPERVPPGAELQMAQVDDPSRPRWPYLWPEYRATLKALRQTPSTTRVVNLLDIYPFPALNGPAGRRGLLPTESGLLWMHWGHEDRESAYVQSLETESARDSVVVWSPSTRNQGVMRNLSALDAAVRRNYQPAMRYGPIEIWVRHRPSTVRPGPQ